MLYVPALALMALLTLPKVFATVRFAVWVCDREEHDTVLEIPQGESDEPEIYSIGPDTPETDIVREEGPDERIYYKLYQEDIPLPTADRPFTFRRGTKDEDGGHVTECHVHLVDNREEGNALWSDGISTYGDLPIKSFELDWFLGAGHTVHKAAELSISCVGEEDGIRWQRE